MTAALQNNSAAPQGRNYAVLAGYCAVIVAGLLILAKAGAYYSTGSSSVLSSLMDSVLDSLLSLMALASLYYASRPADENHRWGHGKMEAVSALFQSAVIAAGGAFIVFEAVSQLTHPRPIEHHMIGLAVMLFSIGLTIVLITIQRIALKKTPSLAIEADSVHYSSDIVVNLGVVAVLLLSVNGAPGWIDPLFALGVAIFLANLARQIGSKAVNMLMDAEMPEHERAKIITIIESHSEILGWHDLRMHRNGNAVIISLDIEADGELPLKDAHAFAKDIENEILQIYPNAEVLIHIDPAGNTQDSRHRIKGVHH